jgi:diaminohydroxyphosphoribosylaminopyrimidine deaminase/5-amino-6-(5-phosphoribosylamino)uracil reductase
MARALALAARGEGFVEPNPMVGSVVVKDGAVVGEGWHRRFGGPHAEVEALTAAGEAAPGSTLYVTLEPCAHFGKTPPCTRAIISAGVRRVVAAMRDPFPQVSGAGLRELAAAGIETAVGPLANEASRLCAPYLKLVTHGRPWVIAKWAMTLDGKLATKSGDSKWISGPASREVVHHLRGRVDAILVGSGTAAADDPLLTARPAGPRVATRIVADSKASLSLSSQLVRTAAGAPVLVAASAEAPAENIQRLTAAGCEVFVCAGTTHTERLGALLDELGRRRVTNLLVEGGSRMLGTLFDTGEIDEVHVFIAPKLFGGAGAPSPLAALGVERVAQAFAIEIQTAQQVGEDLYLSGRRR